MHRFHSLDVICSLLKVFLELRFGETVSIVEQMMSVDNYLRIFSRQIKGIVYLGTSSTKNSW